MVKLLRMAVVAGMAGSVSGCVSLAPFSSADAYPVYGNPVNPIPTADYVVACRSVPQVSLPGLESFSTGCRQLLAPAPAVIAVRG